MGNLSFALNYYFGGLNVFGYHLVNIIIHIINGLLVWRLVLLTFKTPMMERVESNSQLKGLIALTSSLIFIAHPIQTQAVTYTVQRYASLATLFYLSSLVLFIKWRLSQGIKGRTIYYLFSILSVIIAMKTKEISFTLPFIIFLYEFTFFDNRASNLIKRFCFLTPFLITLFIIPLNMMGTDKPIVDIIGKVGETAQQTKEISRNVYLFTQFRVIVTYIRLLFLPVNQNLDYDYPLFHSFFKPEVFLSFLFLFSIFSFAIYLFIRSWKAGGGPGLMISFGIFWFFITLSVESSLIPIKDVIFEHRLYLPSLGAVTAFSVGVFYGFDYAKEWFGIKASSLLAACIVLLITALPLGVATYNRNRVWKDRVTLWKDVVIKSPGKARGHNNLGSAYEGEGRFGEAIEEYRVAIRLQPDFALPHDNLGNVYSNRGRFDEAIKEYRAASRLKPDFASAHYNLGYVYYNRGRFDEAIKEYRAALRMEPDKPETYYYLGLSYKETGLKNEAIKAFEKAVELKPMFLDAEQAMASLEKD